VLPPFQVVIAPAEGRVRRLAAPGRRVAAGDVVAVVDEAFGPRRLRATRSGRVGGALSEPGRGVGAGEGLVWLTP
jgi:predicted deacylase